MINSLEYCCHAESRNSFISVVTDLINPLTNQPLFTLDEKTNELVPSENIVFYEIGEVTKGDEENPIPIPGYHADLVATGKLYELLMHMGGWEAIFGLLGKIDYLEKSDKLPNRWVGTSGMSFYKREWISNPVHEFA